MFYLLLALMMIVVNGISIITSRTWSSAFDSALTQRDHKVTIKRADIWNLYSVI
jgi:hypothetical protein